MDEYTSTTFERRRDPVTGNWRTRIVHVLPRCRVSSEFLDAIRNDDTLGRCDLDGDVLTIRDDYGQRFIYRIRWNDYADGGYLAEWPD